MNKTNVEDISQKKPEVYSFYLRAIEEFPFFILSGDIAESILTKIHSKASEGSSESRLTDDVIESILTDVCDKLGDALSESQGDKVPSEPQGKETELANEVELLNKALSEIESQLVSTERMLSITMGCQLRQTQVIEAYRTFLTQIVPATFENIPGVSSVHLHKVLKEVSKVIETADLIPDEILDFCEGLVNARETEEL